MEFVDLRSDTVTKPTVEMRKAMNNAEVGDDVYGEDPTVNALEALSAELMGKEAGLFVSSGTMGNLIAALTHCGRGDEAIMGKSGHTFLYEVGGIAALGGIHSNTIYNNEDGTLDIGEIEGAIREDDLHYPKTRLIILENTQNRCGGIALTQEYTESIGELAKRYGLKLHIDGARIFNAAVLQKKTALEMAGPADTVTFCLSKGLCAPVGSVLCGSGDFIQQARRIRKQLGGGMRQAGILAAAGIVALQTMVERLEEDHQRARALEDELAKVSWLNVKRKPMSTNMVFVDLVDDVKLSSEDVCQELQKHGVLAGTVNARGIRLVTHFWIDYKSIDKAVNAFHKVL